jgi:CelD/BcsL family acetyltransferase involved in cellulose biosynthesis
VASALPADRSVRILARRPAPYIDLSAYADPSVPILDRLSANTRQQLRRSLRAWEKIGPIKLEKAGTPQEADSFLDSLKALHQAYWVGRGKAGAFAEPFFERFHRALIRRPATWQSVDLIRVSAGSRIAGYLYNLVHHGWVAAYQSGFEFGPDADRLRPGLICHLAAIEHYRQAGMRLYDFLGGEARYKRGFADDERELQWLEVRPKSFLRSAVALFPNHRKAGRG